MRQYLQIILYIMLTFPALQSWAATRNITYRDKIYYADSIINKVLQQAPIYSKFIKEYHADYYMKERLNIDRKNCFFRYLPFMFHIRNKERQFIRELYSNVHYTAPDIYDQKKIASVGTIPRRSSLMDAMIEYFHSNIYSNTLLYQKIISPLTRDGKKYYNFQLDSINNIDGYLQYKISFTPRHKSDQLVCGSMIVSDESWSIRRFSFVGYSDLIHFESDIEFGALGSAAELLPVHYNLAIKVHFLGNKIRSSYLTTITYHGITLSGLNHPRRKKSKYDLSDSFILGSDTTSYSSDRNKFKDIRQIPLDSIDQNIYETHDTLKTQEEELKLQESKSKILWGEIGDFLLDRYNINFNNAGSIRCSPIVNPFLMSYSKSSGFAYKQTFKYNRLFTNDKLLRIAPTIGYNFKEKFFYWKINSEYNYNPSKLGSIHIDAGNGNLIYGANILSAIGGGPNQSPLSVYRFKDYYLEIYHSMELVNGVELNTGLSAHRRTAVIPHSDLIGAIQNERHLAYNSWAPRIRLEWTPALYYYMSGKRKVNFKSSFPTFSVDWERGIKGMFKSNCGYERWEFDMQHQIQFGLLQSLYYRVGTGLYTNQHSLYFIDFLNFTRNNLPEQWNDQQNSSFQLLGADWYNASSKYFQVHLLYESPFLIIPRILKIMQNIVVERFYFNLLMTPKLKPYYEIGYGVGTHYFNLQAYGSFKQQKFVETGMKFTFELFDK